MDRTADLRADYDRLGAVLAVETDGSKVAALVRERRIIGELLEGLETPKGKAVVDQLAQRRSGAIDSGPTSRRRKSG